MAHDKHLSSKRSLVGVQKLRDGQDHLHPEDTRNDQLNRSACAVGLLVGGPLRG